MARYRWEDKELKETMLKGDQVIEFSRWLKTRTYVTEDMVMVTDFHGSLKALGQVVDNHGYRVSTVWMGGKPFTVDVARAVYSHMAEGFDRKHWVVPLYGDKASRKLADWTSMPVPEARYHLGLSKLPAASQLLVLRETMTVVEIAKKFGVHRRSVYKALSRGSDPEGEAAKQVRYQETWRNADIRDAPDYEDRVAAVMARQAEDGFSLWD